MPTKRRRGAFSGSALATAVLLGACSQAAPGQGTPQAPAAPVTVTVTAPPVTSETTERRDGATPEPTVTNPSSGVSSAAPSDAPLPTSDPSSTEAAQSGDSSWPAVVDASTGGVVRIDVASCDARWMGSGFVVGPDLVMTANHVVDGASAITVQSEDGVTNARVVGRDAATDSALIRTDVDVAGGRVLRFQDDPPQVGSALAVLGFPLQTYDLRFTQGSLSGLHEDVTYPGQPTVDAMVTDTAINPGNSGGPALDTAGKVVGLVSGKRLWVTGGPGADPVDGVGYIVPSADLTTRLQRWRAQPDEQPAACGNDLDETGLSRTIDVSWTSEDSDAPDIGRSLLVHGSAINSGNYDAAWQVFSPRLQRKFTSVEAWSSGLSTSYWTGIAIRSVSGSGASKTARTLLMTEQSAADGQDGQTCSLWLIDYGMKRVDGGWLIDSAKAKGEPDAC